MKHSVEELREVFDYKDGILYWKSPSRFSNRKIGDIAGSLENKGYTEIRYLGKNYKRHRLIYYIFTGKWPKLLDHIDQDRQNDRIENLREVTYSFNSHNSSKIWGKIPFRGVSFDIKFNKFSAKCCIKGQKTFIGLFNSPEEASNAYVKFKNDNILNGDKPKGE